MGDVTELDSTDSDTPELDLTPRPRDQVKRGSKLGPSIVIAVVLAVIGFVLFQGLSGATLFVRTADTAVSERVDLGERRFRLTGTPTTVTNEDGYEFQGNSAVRFSIACDGVAADIIHVGNVAEAFQLGVPVVLEGRWASSAPDMIWDNGANDGFYFQSDRMLVEHDNEYREDRLDEAASCGTDAPDAPVAEDASGSES